jgi:hypothetical protein
MNVIVGLKLERNVIAKTIPSWHITTPIASSSSAVMARTPGGHPEGSALPTGAALGSCRCIIRFAPVIAGDPGTI